MHNHDDKYPARPGFEPGTYRLQAPVDTNEPLGPATYACGIRSRQIWLVFKRGKLWSFIVIGVCRGRIYPARSLNYQIYPLGVNPSPARVSYLIIHPSEVVFRYRDPQLQVSENYSNLLNLKPNRISKFWYLNAHLFPINLIWIANKRDCKRLCGHDLW